MRAALGEAAGDDPAPAGCDLLPNASYACRFEFEFEAGKRAEAERPIPATGPSAVRLLVRPRSASSDGFELEIRNSTETLVVFSVPPEPPAWVGTQPPERRRVDLVDLSGDPVVVFRAMPAGFTGVALPARPASYEVLLEIDPARGTELAGAVAGSPADPHVRDAEGDAPVAALDLLSAWFDDPVLDDGLVEVGLELRAIPEHAEGDGTTYSYRVTWSLLGAEYAVRFLFEPRAPVIEGGDGSWVWDTRLLRDGDLVLRIPLEVDEEAGTLRTRVPIRALGDVARGDPFTNVTAVARSAPFGAPFCGAACESEDVADGASRPFALGGPEVWSALRGATVSTPPAPEDPLGPWLLGGILGGALLAAVLAPVALRRRAPTAVSPPTVGEVFLGKYHVEREVGRGAFGAAYLARHLNLDRRVVIKRLHPEWSANAEAIDRFRREARILAAVDHPHVTRVYDVELAAGSWYLVMEFVDGGSLEQRLERGRVPWEVAVATALGVLDGLAHIHAKGVLHRDLKPANILLTTSGVAKIADFGVARSSEAAERTRGEDGAGTLLYMAPEQVRGGSAEARSDLYAVGALLHEIATGRSHLDAASHDVFEVRSAIAEGRLLLDASLPPAVRTFLLHALATRPEDRFPDATTMRRALLDALEGSAPTS